MSDDDFSDGLDEFEESRDDSPEKKKSGTKYSNQPYDEGLEVSQDLSVASEMDGGHKKGLDGRERKLTNDQYDEAVDVSMSVAGSSPSKTPPKRQPAEEKEMGPSAEMSKSTSIANRPFDEAFEVSRSGSEESFDSRESEKKKPTPSKAQQAASKSPHPTQSRAGGDGAVGGASALPKQSKTEYDENEDEESGSDEDDAGEESYENLEGAYNPKDYANLNVTADVKDLFQYIERYKPQEVDLDTVLKCFIPEYIPAVGEIDSFVKVPKPDAKPDDLGLRYLDEPAALQSDPTVLELQLRAKSKKQQYGDVAVRSIEDAVKSPGQIDRWIQNIQELHRSKPPQQVHYKRNMPDPDRLMEVWPSDFEQALKEIPLPSPDLDLSLAEYSKVLCNILDIPFYENPIESLHVLFSLYMDFKDNAHFQAAGVDAGAEAKAGMDFGGDDVLMMEEK